MSRPGLVLKFIFVLIIKDLFGCNSIINNFIFVRLRLVTNFDSTLNVTSYWLVLFSDWNLKNSLWLDQKFEIQNWEIWGEHEHPKKKFQNMFVLFKDHKGTLEIQIQVGAEFRPYKQTTSTCKNKTTTKIYF